MDAQVLTALIAAGSGLAIATIGAAVSSALGQRAATDDDLRATRVKTYPWVWHRTAVVSHWPAGRTLPRTELETFHAELRAWYFGLDDVSDDVKASPGGLYLSEEGKNRYNELQRLVHLALEVTAAGENVASDVYGELRDSCSAFRSVLTEDLETRRKRSLLHALALRRRNRRRRIAAQARADALAKRANPP